MTDSKENHQLMPHQIENIYDEEDAPIMDFKKKIVRKASWVAGVIFLLFLIAGIWVKIPRHLNFDFKLNTLEKEFIAQYDQKLFILEKHGTPGQRVAKGDPVITATSDNIVNYLSKLHDATSKYKIYTTSEKEMMQKTLQIMKLELNNQKQNKKALQNDISHLKKISSSKIDQLRFQYTLEKKQFERQKGLLKQGVIADVEFEKAENQFKKIENELQVTRAQYKRELATLQNKQENTTSEINIIKQKIENYQQKYNLKKTQIEQEINSIKAQISYAFGNTSIDSNGLIINAPISGKISYVFEGEKEVPTGSILFIISNDIENMYAQSSIPPEFIGMVHDDNPVVLKIASFPHYEFGVLRGKIKNLSVTPNVKGNYPFDVEITDFGNLKPFLQKGMNGKLSVVVDRKSFFGYLSEKLNKGFSRLVDN